MSLHLALEALSKYLALPQQPRLDALAATSAGPRHLRSAFSNLLRSRCGTLSIRGALVDYLLLHGDRGEAAAAVLRMYCRVAACMALLDGQPTLAIQTLDVAEVAPPAALLLAPTMRSAHRAVDSGRALPHTTSDALSFYLASKKCPYTEFERSTSFALLARHADLCTRMANGIDDTLGIASVAAAAGLEASPLAVARADRLASTLARRASAPLVAGVPKATNPFRSVVCVPGGANVKMIAADSRLNCEQEIVDELPMDAALVFAGGCAWESGDLASAHMLYAMAGSVGLPCLAALFLQMGCVNSAMTLALRSCRALHASSSPPSSALIVETLPSLAETEEIAIAAAVSAFPLQLTILEVAFSVSAICHHDASLHTAHPADFIALPNPTFGEERVFAFEAQMASIDSIPLTSVEVSPNSQSVYLFFAGPISQSECSLVHTALLSSTNDSCDKGLPISRAAACELSAGLIAASTALLGTLSTLSVRCPDLDIRASTGVAAASPTVPEVLLQIQSRILKASAGTLARTALGYCDSVQGSALQSRLLDYQGQMRHCNFCGFLDSVISSSFAPPSFSRASIPWDANMMLASKFIGGSLFNFGKEHSSQAELHARDVIIAVATEEFVKAACQRTVLLLDAVTDASLAPAVSDGRAQSESPRQLSMLSIREVASVVRGAGELLPLANAEVVSIAALKSLSMSLFAAMQSFRTFALAQQVRSLPLKEYSIPDEHATGDAGKFSRKTTKQWLPHVYKAGGAARAALLETSVRTQAGASAFGAAAAEARRFVSVATASAMSLLEPLSSQEGLDLFVSAAASIRGALGARADALLDTATARSAPVSSHSPFILSESEAEESSSSNDGASVGELLLRAVSSFPVLAEVAATDCPATSQEDRRALRRCFHYLDSATDGAMAVLVPRGNLLCANDAAKSAADNSCIAVGSIARKLSAALLHVACGLLPTPETLSSRAASVSNRSASPLADAVTYLSNCARLVRGIPPGSAGANSAAFATAAEDAARAAVAEVFTFDAGSVSSSGNRTVNFSSGARVAASLALTTACGALYSLHLRDVASGAVLVTASSAHPIAARAGGGSVAEIVTASAARWQFLAVLDCIRWISRVCLMPTPVHPSSVADTSPVVDARLVDATCALISDCTADACGFLYARVLLPMQSHAFPAALSQTTLARLAALRMRQESALAAYAGGDGSICLSTGSIAVASSSGRSIAPARASMPALACSLPPVAMRVPLISSELLQISLEWVPHTTVPDCFRMLATAGRLTPALRPRQTCAPVPPHVFSTAASTADEIFDRRSKQPSSVGNDSANAPITAPASDGTGVILDSDAAAVADGINTIEIAWGRALELRLRQFSQWNGSTDFVGTPSPRLPWWLPANLCTDDGFASFVRATALVACTGLADLPISVFEANTVGTGPCVSTASKNAGPALLPELVPTSTIATLTPAKVSIGAAVSRAIIAQTVQARQQRTDSADKHEEKSLAGVRQGRFAQRVLVPPTSAPVGDRVEPAAAVRSAVSAAISYRRRSSVGSIASSVHSYYSQRDVLAPRGADPVAPPWASQQARKEHVSPRVRLLVSPPVGERPGQIQVGLQAIRASATPEAVPLPRVLSASISLADLRRQDYAGAHHPAGGELPSVGEVPQSESNLLPVPAVSAASSVDHFAEAVVSRAEEDNGTIPPAPGVMDQQALNSHADVTAGTAGDTREEVSECESAGTREEVSVPKTAEIQDGGPYTLGASAAAPAAAAAERVAAAAAASPTSVRDLIAQVLSGKKGALQELLSTAAATAVAASSPKEAQTHPADSSVVQSASSAVACLDASWGDNEGELKAVSAADRVLTAPPAQPQQAEDAIPPLAAEAAAVAAAAGAAAAPVAVAIADTAELLLPPRGSAVSAAEASLLLTSPGLLAAVDLGADYERHVDQLLQRIAAATTAAKPSSSSSSFSSSSSSSSSRRRRVGLAAAATTVAAAAAAAAAVVAPRATDFGAAPRATLTTDELLQLLDGATQKAAAAREGVGGGMQQQRGTPTAADAAAAAPLAAAAAAATGTTGVTIARHTSAAAAAGARLSLLGERLEAVSGAAAGLATSAQADSAALEAAAQQSAAAQRAARLKALYARVDDALGTAALLPALAPAPAFDESSCGGSGGNV